MRSITLWNNWGGLGSISQWNLQSQVLISTSLLELLLSGWWRPHFYPSHFIVTSSNSSFLENFRIDKTELSFMYVPYHSTKYIVELSSKSPWTFPNGNFSLSLLSKTTVPHWAYYSWHACPRQWGMNKMEEKGNNGASIAPKKFLVKYKGNKFFSLENYKCSTKYLHKKIIPWKKVCQNFWIDMVMSSLRSWSPCS